MPGLEGHVPPPASLSKRRGGQLRGAHAWCVPPKAPKFAFLWCLAMRTGEVRRVRIPWGQSNVYSGLVVRGLGEGGEKK